MILAAVDDLLFSSKIRAAAAGAGDAVTFVRNPDNVKAACAEHQPRLVLIDLDRDTLKPIETISMIRGMPARGGVPCPAALSAQAGMTV